MAAPSFQDKFDDPPGQATLPGVEPSIGRNYAPPDEHFWFDPKEQVKDGIHIHTSSRTYHSNVLSR